MQRNYKWVLLFVGWLFCFPAPVHAQHRPHLVSIVQLLANPDKYDGKRVQVTGYVHLGFESDSVFLHKEDGDNLLDSNGLELDIRQVAASNSDRRQLQARLSGKYDIIEGTFLAGQVNLFQGRIVDITRFTLWSDPTTRVSSGSANTRRDTLSRDIVNEGNKERTLAEHYLPAASSSLGTLNGKHLKAFLVAYDDLQTNPRLPASKKMLQNYEVTLGESKDSYYVLFIPKSPPLLVRPDGTILAPTGGGNVNGETVRYTVSKDGFRVTRKLYYE